MAKYQPKHQAQLGRGTPVPGATKGSMDCGPRSIQMAMDAQTQGRLHPGPEKELRDKMRTPGAVQTNIWDAQVGVERYHGGDGNEKSKGHKPMRYYIKRTIEEVKSAVSGGKPVHVCISYKKWNKLVNKTGDPNFKGGHSIMVYGQKKDDKGVIKWKVFDPLEDARRKEIPQGPRWIHRQYVIDSMVDFSPTKSKNQIYAGVVQGGQKK